VLDTNDLETHKDLFEKVAARGGQIIVNTMDFENLSKDLGVIFAKAEIKQFIYKGVKVLPNNMVEQGNLQSIIPPYNPLKLMRSKKK
jgi:hypothetical protein